VSRETPFRIFATLFAGAAIYHAVAFFYPAVSDERSHWRHAAFCGIDLVCAWCLIKRPKWFVVAFLLLTFEAIWGHGKHAWLLWHMQSRIDWLSLAVLIVVPLAMALLVKDARRQPGSSA
jgi:hypothetical protein